MKKILIYGILLLLPFWLPEITSAKTVSGGAVEITSKAVVLIEGNTGEILIEKNKDTELVPASITKIMTLDPVSYTHLTLPTMAVV